MWQVFTRILLTGLVVLLMAMHGAPAAAAPQVVATIALPDPVRCDYVSVDAAAYRLYVAHRERVDVIVTQGDKPVLQLAPTRGVYGAAAAMPRRISIDSRPANPHNAWPHSTA
jgi:hypothetical protein